MNIVVLSWIDGTIEVSTFPSAESAIRYAKYYAWSAQRICGIRINFADETSAVFNKHQVSDVFAEQDGSKPIVSKVIRNFVNTL